MLSQLLSKQEVIAGNTTSWLSVQHIYHNSKNKTYLLDVNAFNFTHFPHKRITFISHSVHSKWSFSYKKYRNDVQHPFLYFSMQTVVAVWCKVTLNHFIAERFAMPDMQWLLSLTFECFGFAWKVCKHSDVGLWTFHPFVSSPPGHFAPSKLVSKQLFNSAWHTHTATWVIKTSKRWYLGLNWIIRNRWIRPWGETSWGKRPGANSRRGETSRYRDVKICKFWLSTGFNFSPKLQFHVDTIQVWPTRNQSQQNSTALNSINSVSQQTPQAHFFLGTHQCFLIMSARYQHRKHVLVSIVKHIQKHKLYSCFRYPFFNCDCNHFCIVITSLWVAVREAGRLYGFKCKLKTHLFSLCFNDYLFLKLLLFAFPVRCHV